MASQRQIDTTYNYMDETFRLAIGECADISCALFDGDYRKSLERAQQDKHDYILASIRLRRGARILDIGCGWGPVLRAVESKGGHAIGLTLSTRQLAACQSHGFEVYLQDWRELNPETFGLVDGIISVGSFEHFCSEEEHAAGRQEEIYRQFFCVCSELLPDDGRLFLQSMVWGPKVPLFENVSLDAPKGSNEYMLAVLRKFYPGSFLPRSLDQIRDCAQPFFRIMFTKNGRLDYVETMQRWRRMWSWRPRMLLALGKLAPMYLMDGDFRKQIESLLGNYNLKCLEREVIDHERIVLEKV